MAFHDYPKLLEEFYVRRMRETYRERGERLDAIRTPEDARGYVQYVRGAIRAAFGPLPERTPLNARTVRVSEFDGYVIEHVIFESRPGFLVTANLYLPAQRAGRLPAVLFPCGHSVNGKAHPLYATACTRLAREGYAVLVYDPINQGERDIYSLVDTGGRLTRNGCCAGHNVIGRQLHACGEWFGTWRLWDGIRAVDYLVSRPEVDPERLGLTGQSGGGTMSAYIWSMEHRLGMVASSCWTTSYLLDLENSMPADEEQYPPGFLAAGLDKVDFFMARAGEPALLLGQEFDYFDNRGLRHGHAELLRVHQLMGGAPDTCRVALDVRTHGYTDANQLTMLAFFNEVIGKPAPAADRPVEVLEESVLAVTEKLDVNRAGSRPMNEMVAERARQVAAGRAALAPENVAGAIQQALKVRLPDAAPHHRRLFHTGLTREESGRQVFRFVVEPEPGILCVLRRICAEGNPFRMNPGERAVLCVPNLDSQAELDRAEGGAGTDEFWMLDPRGLGEGLFTADDPFTLYGHDYMLSGHAVMCAESMLGDRVSDVLSAVELLRSEGAAEVHLVGWKQGAVVALLSAALDAHIPTVRSIEAPDSFLALATAAYTFWPAANFPHGVLREFDLPEVRQALGERLIEDTRCEPDEFSA